MERFVLVTAITLALIYGAWRLWGLPSMSFADDSPMHSAEAVMPGQQGHVAQTFATHSIEIRHAAAHVTITPEDRADVAVEITNPGRAPMPSVELSGGKVLIDGHFRGRIEECTDNGGARVRGYGEFAAADLTQIIIHAPRELVVALGGAVTSQIGPSQTLDVSYHGCGDGQLGDVAGRLDLDLAGSGHVRGGSAQGLDVDLAGSGEVVLGAVTDHAKISAAGSGDVTLASLTGELQSEDAGSGSLTISGGSITTAHMELAGSGNAHVAAPIQNLHAEIVGVGDVDVTATVGDLYAEIAGPGSVHVQAATGTVRRDIMGPGQVVVGR